MCRGVHVMAIGWEDKVPGILEAAGYADPPETAREFDTGLADDHPLTIESQAEYRRHPCPAPWFRLRRAKLSGSPASPEHPLFDTSSGTRHGKPPVHERVGLGRTSGQGLRSNLRHRRRSVPRRRRRIARRVRDAVYDEPRRDRRRGERSRVDRQQGRRGRRARGDPRQSATSRTDSTGNARLSRSTSTSSPVTSPRASMRPGTRTRGRATRA